MSNLYTLRPGLLVSLNTSIRGNVSYQKVELEGRHRDEEGQERARWETTRVITDPVEHDAAVKIRSKVRSLIVGQCATSAFGLLCPEANLGDLQKAIKEAQELASEFNDNAEHTRMTVNVIYGRIAQDDVSAARAIAGEIRGLMEDIQEGLSALDVNAIRAACDKARNVGGMLTPETKGRLDEAIAVARSAARRIVKAGEVAALEIDQAALEQVDKARVAFLDIEGSDDVAAPEMDARGVDFDTTPVEHDAGDVAPRDIEL